MDQQTGSIGTRQKQKAETRQRVLAAARKLFEAQGYTAVTVRMISEEAGVAVGSVFTAFDSKDDVLVAIVCEDLDTFAAIFVQRMKQTAHLPLAARIAAAFEPAIAYDVAHLNKLREAMASSWTRSLDQELLTRAAMSPIIVTLREAIKAAQAAGQVGQAADPAVLAEMILPLYGAALRRVAFDDWDAKTVAARFQTQLEHVLR
jgi:TetR/AcrR family transcriptional regulator, cholesterol catabolism regulator